MASVDTISILGPGLLGGSVALAAKARGCAEKIHIWARREPAVDQIRELGIADLASTDLAEVVADSQLIILATPVGVMPTLVSKLLELPLSRATIVTDLGSVKRNVVDSIDQLLLSAGSGLRFVGSHPMAGKEQAGIEHATADLFQGAACVLTPGRSSDASSVEQVREFWRALGCNTSEMHAAEHDEAVARISHLPHLAASLITATALEDSPSFGSVAGAGMRDTTRVASGSPEMWAEILLENRSAIAPALSLLRQKVDEALELLEADDHEALRRLLQQAKDLRDQLPSPPPPSDVD
ncbi:MAG: prephenate dehydrogenase [Verrucomicrobiales bacterium]